MTKLTPLILEHEELLRRLAQAPARPLPDTKAALAKELGRDVSNLNRTLKLLDAAGLTYPGGGFGVAEKLGITEAGREAVAALDRAAGITANAVRPPRSSSEAGPSESATPEGFAWLRFDELEADPQNARKTFSDEDIAELADSMAAKGLLQKPAARPRNTAGKHQLILGERRRRAWGLLIERGTWPADHVELLPVMEGDDAFFEEAGLIENLQRKDLKPLEEARGFQRLVETHGHTTATIAEKVGFTQRFVQQRLQLLDLRPGDMLALEQGAMTIEEARRRLANYPKPLSPLAHLALAEMIDLSPELAQGASVLVLATLTTKSNEYRSWAEASIEDPAYEEIRARWLIAPVATESQAGVYTGRARVSWAWNAKATIKAEYPDLASGKQRPERLAELRRDSGLADPGDGGPWTSWLRPGAEISPDVAAKIEAANAERKRQEEADAERRKLHEERRASQELVLADGAKQARSLAVDFSTTTAAAEGAKLLLTAIEAPLPWRWLEGDDNHSGQVVAADGSEVDIGGWETGEILGPLVMAAVNRAGGFEPIFGKVSDDSPDDDDQDDEDREDEDADVAGALDTPAPADDDGPLIDPADSVEDDDAEIPGTLKRLAGIPDTQPEAR